MIVTMFSHSGKVEVGGSGGVNFPSRIDIPFDTCDTPRLPDERAGYSVSVLSGKKLVVCGGNLGNGLKLTSCLSWAKGEDSWTEIYKMR